MAYFFQIAHSHSFPVLEILSSLFRLFTYQIPVVCVPRVTTRDGTGLIVFLIMVCAATFFRVRRVSPQSPYIEKLWLGNCLDCKARQSMEYSHVELILPSIKSSLWNLVQPSNGFPMFLAGKYIYENSTDDQVSVMAAPCYR